MVNLLSDIRYTIGYILLLSMLLVRLVIRQPESITEGTRVSVTIPTIDYPEYTDSQTIIRRGDWEVRVKGYIDFIPGEVIEVEGVVDERGRVVAEASDSNIATSNIVISDRENIGVIDRTLIAISYLRRWAVGRLQTVLPEPHASLVIGILLGVKRGMPRDFYDQLVNTGTLHVVAASGYNVSVVSGVILTTLGLILPRYMALGISLIGVGLYVLLAGSGPAIIRAGIMGSLSLIGIMLGRVREARWLLWVTAWVMLMVKPVLIADVGFQLSLSATLGLLYLTPILERCGKHKYLSEYLYPTLAATIATSPVIWWHFGRVSLVGVLVNMLILPVVPIIMMLAALTVIFNPVAYLLYVPLWWMVWVIRMFG